MPRIGKGDVVRRRGDISRKGKVLRMTESATKASVKWDYGSPQREDIAVELLERTRRKGEPHKKGGLRK